LLLGLLFAQFAVAALPPEERFRLDKAVIERYIASHPDEAKLVERIDYRNFVIYLKNGCAIYFVRGFQFRLPGWVGAQPPLEFDRKVCLEDAEIDFLLDERVLREGFCKAKPTPIEIVEAF